MNDKTTYTLRTPGMSAWIEGIDADRALVEWQAAKRLGLAVECYRDSDLVPMAIDQDGDLVERAS